MWVKWVDSILTLTVATSWQNTWALTAETAKVMTDLPLGDPQGLLSKCNIGHGCALRNVGVRPLAGLLIIHDLRQFGWHHICMPSLNIAAPSTIPLITTKIDLKLSGFGLVRQA